MLIPLDYHLSNEAVSSILQFFLSHSNLAQVRDEKKSKAESQPKFDFKCIGMQMGVTKAPLNTPSLHSVQTERDSKAHLNSIRVISLLFDTFDEPKHKDTIFEEVINRIGLETFLKGKDLDLVNEKYKAFITSLALKYHREGKLKHFPLFGIKAVGADGIEFVNEKQFDKKLTLGHIAFFARFTQQDDIAPLETKESWGRFR